MGVMSSRVNINGCVCGVGVMRERVMEVLAVTRSLQLYLVFPKDISIGQGVKEGVGYLSCSACDTHLDCFGLQIKGLACHIVQVRKPILP